MDRIAHAESILSAAKARHPGACLPGGAGSPADRLGTLTLPHELIAECDAAVRADAHLREMAHAQASRSVRSPGAGQQAVRPA